MKRRPPQLDLPVLRKRLLHTHEAELWRSVMEMGTLPKHIPDLSPAPAPMPVSEAPAKKPAKKPNPQPHKLDNVSRTKIHKGKKAIDATLDLHGFTVDVAYRTLVQCVARVQGKTTRIILVITGKGRVPQSGILRAQLPHWLERSPLREQVSGYSPAGSVHGGEGAWYLTIRKLPVVKR